MDEDEPMVHTVAGGAGTAGGDDRTRLGEPTAGDDLRSLGAAAGAADILIFRRVSPNGHVHLGGWGRGTGWAGIVDVDDVSDPVFEQAVRTGEIIRHHGASARTPDGVPVSASIGCATMRPGNTVEETFHEADSAMYADKAERRP